jgi:ABC-type protease/lipase transport system fused ATPase/permease subunit
MTYDHDALRQELTEAQQRISELSTALELVTKQRNDWKHVADDYWNDLEAEKKKSKFLQATVDRLRLHIQQGVEL